MDQRKSPPDTAGALPSPGRIVQNWKGAYERARDYLAYLGVDEHTAPGLAVLAVEEALRAPAWDAEAEAVGETLKQLRRLLMEKLPAAGTPSNEPEEAFRRWRLGRAWRGSLLEKPSAPGADRLCSMPPLARTSMAANRFRRGLLRRTIVHPSKRNGRAESSPKPGEPAAGKSRSERRRSMAWLPAARRRRLLLSVLVLIPSAIASLFMLQVLPYKGGSPLEVAIVLFFAALFGWISIGFWTSLFGFFILARGRGRFSVTSATEPPPDKQALKTRTAIVMPICDEPVERVFAGLKVIDRSLERQGVRDLFDFFILSDTADPGCWVREEEAWFNWCRETAGFQRIFYRRRRVRLKRKSGNVADFCRRWGRNYPYMVVLDADSIMSGEALTRLVHLMETRPDVALIQTFPVAVNRRSLLARVQQFSNRLYGPIFAAGLHFWQMGEGQYWGHNAIIRVTPFMEHCSLPKLPGKPPLGGEIFSHDFVEAALLGRAGWAVWLAYDLPGSYEETPSSLLEEMGRDRRWCQGNLQHLKLLFLRGLVGPHRILFFQGALSYVSAFLWFGFLILSTIKVLLGKITTPSYFPSAHTLFPNWPIWRPDLALVLVAVTAIILFLPKFLSVALVTWGRRSRLFGGFSRLMASVLLEILLSALLAPIRMMFHARFVVLTFLGRKIPWAAQSREDSQTPWSVAIRRHGIDTVVGTVWGLGVYWLDPGYFWWMAPIVGALILSIPVSVFTSRVTAGRRARALGLFLTPEESAAPTELEELRQEEVNRGKEQGTDRDGFRRAVVYPETNALHCSLLGCTPILPATVRNRRKALVERALAEGPGALSSSERRTLLYDRERMTELHRRAWQLPSGEQVRQWISPHGRRG